VKPRGMLSPLARATPEACACLADFVVDFVPDFVVDFVPDVAGRALGFADASPAAITPAASPMAIVQRDMRRRP